MSVYAHALDTFLGKVNAWTKHPVETMQVTKGSLALNVTTATESKTLNFEFSGEKYPSPTHSCKIMNMSVLTENPDHQLVGIRDMTHFHIYLQKTCPV